ncbi:DUF7167 family protein [Bacillus sp. Marseille-P3800]|uniref:DUF7167 family protein n=1 Tax=Bacillus sp. Marseille-P3800 TaxID=2014782 RepID=UPI000C088084|nr:hypothetical protein [Bacillus sp. Marseille-P3800]
MFKQARFTFSVGYHGVKHEKTFSFEELGITKDMTQEQIEEILTKEYYEWRNDYLNGGWSIEEA